MYSSHWPPSPASHCSNFFVFTFIPSNIFWRGIAHFWKTFFLWLTFLIFAGSAPSAQYEKWGYGGNEFNVILFSFTYHMMVSSSYYMHLDIFQHSFLTYWPILILYCILISWDILIQLLNVYCKSIHSLRMISSNTFSSVGLVVSATFILWLWVTFLVLDGMWLHPTLSTL